MASVLRIITALTFFSVAAITMAALIVPEGAEAGTAVATCTKAPDLRYDCTKLLVVGDHIQMNANGGICHANVTATGTISATLRSASLNINHNVSNCAWQPGITVAIGYRLAATPTPSGGPVSVGGIVGLRGGDGVEASASTSGGSGTGMSIALVVGAAGVALIGVGAFARLRSKGKAVRE